MAVITRLLDQNKQSIYPITKAGAVFTSDGSTIEDKLATIDQHEVAADKITGVLSEAHGGTGNTEGRAKSADKLSKGINVTLSGSVTGSTAATVDGSGDIEIVVEAVELAKKATNATEAETAGKLKTAQSFSISDSAEVPHTGEETTFDGSGAAVLKLPDTIEASFIGDLTGNASTATTATNAGHADSADTATSANSAKTAESAGKLTAPVNITISDSAEEGPHTGTAVAFDGSSAVTLILPETITADLEGNATTATTAATATNATTADTAKVAEKLKTPQSITLTGAATGSTEVGFDGSAGVTINVETLDASKFDGVVDVTHGGTGNTTGEAPSATVLATAHTFTIQDNAEEANKSTPVSFDGSADVTLTLPETIQATTFVGNLTGKADSAKTADTATNATKADTAGSADTATTASTLAASRSFTVTDASGENSGEAATFDGSADVTLALPDTIKATTFEGSLTGTASEATHAATATNATSADTAKKVTGVLTINDGSEEAKTYDGSAAVEITIPEAPTVVTQSADGLMLAADKKKLDAYPTLEAKVTDVCLLDKKVWYETDDIDEDAIAAALAPKV